MQMLRILSGCAFGAALLTSTARVSAADPAPAPSGSALPEIGRVTTSDRRSEPIDRTARPTFVIDRARLDATGARTVSDALRSIPGVAIYSFGPFGSQSDYGIRGTNSAQTLVLLDGVPIANVSSGTIDLGTFPLVNVSRIEVVESGSSTLYGTSAIGGVINIITGARRGAEVLLSAGSFGDDDVRLGAGDGKIGVAFERHVATNAFAYPMLRYGTVTFPAATRTNSWATQTALRFTALESFGSGFSVRADLGGDATRSAVPGRLDFPSPRALQSVARNNALLEVTKTFSNSALSLTLSGARSALSYSDPDSGGETNTYDARTQLSLKEVVNGAHGSFVAGLDLARENALLSLGPFGPPASFNGAESQVALYLQQQLQLAPGVEIVAGVRGENDAPRGSVAAPSFGANFRLGSVRLAGNVGESFRVPTLIDLYYPGFSNPNLVPEKARTYDATLEQRGTDGTLSLGWFGRTGSNFIVLDSNFLPANVQRASVAGVMLTAASRSYSGLIADLGVTDTYRARNDLTGARLPHNPVVQATVGLTHPFGKSPVAFGLRAHIVGSSIDPAFGFGPIVNDAYTTADAYVRFKLAPEAIVSLRLKNFGDARYAPVPGYPAAGRTMWVEFSTR